MPTADYSSYHQNTGTTSDGAKFNNLIDAVQATVNGLDANNMAAGFKRTTSSLAGGPPGSPTDGDIWIATSVDAIGTRWMFQYNGGSASAFKWEFIGGLPRVSYVAAAEATTGGWVDLATVGPSYTIVRAGDYMADFGVSVSAVGSSNAGNAEITVAKNGVPVGIASSVSVPNVAGCLVTTVQKNHPVYALTGLAVSDVLKLQYLISNGSSTTFSNRWLAVTPLRVS